jgi:predicted ABC-type sugar transport system permease subunit
MTGVILLVFIGALIAWVISRGRRKVGMSFAGKHWQTIIVAVVVIGAVMYAASINSH